MSLSDNETAFIAFISTFIILSFLGNVCVVVVIMKIKTLRTVTNMFLTNLAVSDMILVSLIMPLQVHDMSHTDEYDEYNSCRSRKHPTTYRTVGHTLQRCIGNYFPKCMNGTNTERRISVEFRLNVGLRQWSALRQMLYILVEVISRHTNTEDILRKLLSIRSRLGGCS
ncbi:hypothetical protein LSAT2_009139 [Lamellibrachia satsuma]|nr:hypothetical protein LSAT2_009139 [Lamellibrachia satsuma]